MISSAMFGPESTATGRFPTSVERRAPVAGSRPFVRLSTGAHESPRYFGPFNHVRTAGGLLYGDDACLNIPLPGRNGQEQSPGHQLTFLGEGESNAKA